MSLFNKCSFEPYKGKHDYLWTHAIAYVALALLLVGCNRSTQPGSAIERLVKVDVIRTIANNDAQVHSGQVRARNRMCLGFQVAGRVTELAVEIGDNVSAGQLLASLEREPFELRLRHAQADLNNAKASLGERQHRFDSEKRLLSKGATSLAEYRETEASLTAAASQVEAAEAALHLTERDLDNTVLRAPVAGRVAQRLIHRFSEVAVGSSAFEIDGEGGVEVLVRIPETLARRLSVGDPAKVIASGARESIWTANITKIGARSEGGMSVPILVGVETPSSDLLPGSAVEVAFAGVEVHNAPVVPLAALLAGPTTNSAAVYVYRPTEHVVSKRQLTLGEPCNEGFRVRSGLLAGERVVVAGVSFLSDGQKVRTLPLASSL